MTTADIANRLKAHPAGPGRWMAKCPSHADKSPSLSIATGNDGRTLLRCFAGCTVEAITAALGLRLGDLFSEPTAAPRPQVIEESPEAKRARWPVFELPTREELHAIGELRCLGELGLALAAERDLLRVADYYGRVWVVTDPTRTAAQVRRLDGRLMKKTAKAITLPGSVCSLPIGLPHVAQARVILLCEGGPDLLAAHHFIFAESREADTCAVGMLGASHNLAEAVLPAFAGKRVRVFPHDDAPGPNGRKAGLEAARRWTRALQPFASKVDWLTFDGYRKANGEPVADFNDLTQVDPDCFESHRELWSLVPSDSCLSSNLKS